MADTHPRCWTMQQCNPIERAQYNVVLAKAINVLYAMYLKTQGVDPDKHPVAKELVRTQTISKVCIALKDFIPPKLARATNLLSPYSLKERIAKYGDKLKAADSSGPKLSLDSEAALRFIDRSLPDLSPEKKKALKEVSGIWCFILAFPRTRVCSTNSNMFPSNA